MRSRAIARLVAGLAMQTARLLQRCALPRTHQAAAESADGNEKSRDHWSRLSEFLSHGDKPRGSSMILTCRTSAPCPPAAIAERS